MRTLARVAPCVALAIGVLASPASADSKAAPAERRPRVVIHYDRDGQVARQEVDTTGAGHPNLWVHYERGVMVRQEEDTVGDGRPHVWTLFRDGRPARQEVDTDRDGRADTIFELDAAGRVAKKMTAAGVVTHYEAGLPVREEREGAVAFYEHGKLARVEEDRNRDGRPDVWAVFRDGRRVEQREDPSFTGRATVVYHFENDRLVRSEEATGGDGRFDLVSFYERDAVVRQEGRTACGDRTDV